MVPGGENLRRVEENAFLCGAPGGTGHVPPICLRALYAMSSTQVLTYLMTLLMCCDEFAAGLTDERGSGRMVGWEQTSQEAWLELIKKADLIEVRKPGAGGWMDGGREGEREGSRSRGGRRRERGRK
eukprot:2596798-Rhodomonas_salina.1